VTNTQPDTQPRDVDGLRATGERLFAEHHALSRQFGEREDARRAACAEAMNAQRAAFAAEDQAWDAYDAAQAALHANPPDPSAAEAATKAWAGLEAARTAAHAAQKRAAEVIGKAVDESGQELTQVLQLGEQARSAQDAYLTADWTQRRGDAATDTTGASTAATRPEPS
jgi:hypothetical protein